MKEIGKLLKEEREKLNLSLADAHKATKVQEKYLKAIEDGDTTIFFAEVYYKSFVRSYSKLLGFDPEEIINMINIKNQKKSLKNECENKNIKKSNCKSKNDIKKLLIILVIVIAVILSILILTFGRKVLHEAKDSHIKSYQELPLKQDGNDTFEESVNNDANDEGNVLDKYESNATLVEDKSSNKQEIEIIAKDIVWIRLDKDGKTIYEGNLYKGQRKVWKADKSFTLKIGYAPGLKVFFNGQEVDIIKNAVKDVNTIILEQ
jgi:cytoskeletal protein RodZ